MGNGRRGFNADYLRLVAHYGMRPRTTGIGEKEQNGDVESLNGALKRDLEQQVLLRGSRDFESHAAYRDWLAHALRRRNALREPRLSEERAVLGRLAATRLDVVAVGADDVAKRWRTLLRDVAEATGGRFVAR